MTIQMYQIVEFPSLLAKLKKLKLPFKTAYKLTLLSQEVEKHMNFYQEKFHELVMEYSKKDADGQPLPTTDGQGVQLIEETMDEAYDKLKELRSLDVELPNPSFSIEDFGNIEITTEEMQILMPFIEA